MGMILVVAFAAATAGAFAAIHGHLSANPTAASAGNRW
jgi:hypothetical protein